MSTQLDLDRGGAPAQVEQGRSASLGPLELATLHDIATRSVTAGQALPDLTVRAAPGGCITSCRPALPHLIERITRAVSSATCDSSCCQAIEQALIDAASPDLLPPNLRRPHGEHYARHVVHRDPAGRFSVIAMVWGPGQATPIHDHGGLWCVECVIQGEIQVRAYDSVPRDDGRLGFRCADESLAHQGEAAHVIPPFDHHVIGNPNEQVAVTLHVYGGEMAWCRAFVPHADGGYVAEVRELSVE